MRIITLFSAVALTILASGAAFALDAAPAPDSSTAPKSTTTDTAGSKSARSAECSKEADAKSLHGEKRKKFREACKKGEPTT
jgi:hypothetical protein